MVHSPRLFRLAVSSLALALTGCSSASSSPRSGSGGSNVDAGKIGSGGQSSGGTTGSGGSSSGGTTGSGGATSTGFGGSGSGGFSSGGATGSGSATQIGSGGSGAGGKTGAGGAAGQDGGAVAGSGGSTSYGGSGGCAGTLGSSEHDAVACTLQPLTSDFSGMWDLNQLNFKGTISLNGGVMPSSPYVDSRANVEFRDVVSGRTSKATIQPTGPGTFNIRLYVGTYDVTLITSGSDSLVAMPRATKLRLASVLRIEAGTPLDFDVKTVAVTGVVTLNGAAMPDSLANTPRAEVDFKDVVSGGLIAAQIKPTGPGSFSGLLFASTYNVSLKTSSGATLTTLPLGATAMLADGVAITKDGELDYDVRATALKGVITVDGAQMPDTPGATYRGQVSFVDKKSGQTYVSYVVATGPGAFSVLLFAGTYDVAFKTYDATNLVGLPLGGTLIARGLSIADETALTFDLHVVSVNGNITVNGATMPDSPTASSRGGVQFQNADTGAVTSAAVAATGPGSFSTTLFAGAYEVAFTTPSFGTLVGLPNAASVELARVMDVSADENLAYDVHPISVDGTLTLNGAVLPDSPGLNQRGQIQFVERASGIARGAFVVPTGPGTFGPLGLFAANYDVSFATVDSQALVGLPRARTELLGSNVALTSSRSLNLDVKTVSASGTLTSHGAQMPDDPVGADRGQVTFHDLLTGQSYSFTVGPSGPGTFSGSLFLGAFDVSFDPPDATAGETLDVSCLPNGVCP
jgi:hypothetical protein